MKAEVFLTTLLALCILPAQAEQKAKTEIPTKANAKVLMAAGFKPLFDTKTLAGWKKAGGTGKFKVEDEAIVGFGKNIRGNTFLRTEKNYADFILIFEFQFVDATGNSGCQFRSSQLHKTGRVFGYQCEHDNNKSRSYTAGIYDEARRGWLYPGKFAAGKDVAKSFTSTGQEAFKWNDWNTIVIRCKGDHIQTWLNGVPRADFHDADEKHFTPSGFLALQVHGGKSAHVKWRRLFLKELQ